MSEMDDVVREFLVESHEGLDQLDRDLVALEQSPRDAKLLAAIFRCVHTIKGTCGFLGFGKLESVSHVGENLLSLLRDGKLFLTPEITSALLRLVDAIRQILAQIEADGGEGDVDYSDLVATLTRLAEGSPAPAAGVAEPPAAAEAAAPKKARGSRKAKAAAPEPAVEPVVAPVPVPAAAAPAPAAEAAHAPEPGHPAEAEGRASISESNIRVDVALLDKLMNLVGELVLARNQILQYTASHEDAQFLATSQRLNLITTELQEGVMKTRMQPIGNIWSKFPRVVRDLALQVGKQVAIEMEGRETELDKTIIEAIKDPLTHIVRNSVDHGIESPAARVAAGKPAEGRLLLRAYHEGGQVNIEIADDGGGINAEKVRQKALDRGLVTPEQAARMSERELQNLIFLPGFSTAEKVSNISGRGVGMDVVRTNIEKIGGTVDVQSVAGQGTTLKIKIPLTLAIIPALTVAAEGDRYAIPQVNLLELVRVEPGEGTGIEFIHGAPVYRLRGNLLPLCYLRRELGLPERAAAEGEAVNIVVLHADGRQFGLVVDGIHDTEEIVVKPLGQLLKGLSVFAGATIMGDGRVALILDVLSLAQRAKVVGEMRDQKRELRDRAASLAAAGSTTSLLVFGVGRDMRLAMPLAAVQRLEELPRDHVERAGSHDVVQYRGEILPLIHLARVLGAEAIDDPAKPLQVVVYADRGRQVGLVVDGIHDIVEDALASRAPVGHPDLAGTAVIHDRVTDLLDVQTVVRNACPWLYATEPDAQEALA